MKILVKSIIRLMPSFHISNSYSTHKISPFLLLMLCLLSMTALVFWAEKPLYAESYTSSIDFEATRSMPNSFMEICDNGIDDDGDGLIDAFDPDCECEEAVIPNEIVVNGDPCSVIFSFDVEEVAGASYQWYKDSLPILGTSTHQMLFFQDWAILEGTYNVQVSFPNGNCQLIEPLDYQLPFTLIELNLNLCEGETYELGTQTISSAGEYSKVYYTGSNCDSVITAIATYTDHSEFFFSETINSGETYDFNGEILDMAGIYMDILQNANGCDSIITLDLMVLLGEICDNGIDDDDDGLIDVFDPDCECVTVVDSLNFVPNGDFESRDSCCRYINNPESNCIQNWIPLNGTPDYLSEDCLSDFQFMTFEGSYGLSLEGSILGHLLNNDNPEFTESMGVCLSQTLEAGQSYTLSFDFSHPQSQSQYSVTEDFYYSIIGVSDCSDLMTIQDEVDSPCNTVVSIEELISLNLFTMDTLWNHYEIEITPSMNIQAIFTNFNCTNNPSTPQSAYVFLDNVTIQEIAPITINDEIAQTGNACDENLEFSVEFLENSNYQWYFNETPINGATENIWTPTEMFLDSTGNYQVYIIHEGGNCQLSEALFYEPMIIEFEFSETICTGDFYNFNNENLTATGIYQNTIQSTAGCDSIITLNLMVNEVLESEISETICAGEFYNFNNENLTATGIYQDTIQSTAGCDSIITLNLTVNEVLESEISETICTGEVYNFNNENLTATGIYQDTIQSTAGCDSIITLNLMVNEALEREFSETICTGEVYNFNNENLTATGIYQDTVQNATGCDSIITLILNVTTITITDPEVINVTNCGEEDGQITIHATGQNLEYSLDGMTWQSSNVFSNLTSGVYSYTVRTVGTTNCEVGDMVEIEAPDSPLISNIDVFSESDCGANDGKILINASGNDLIYSNDGGMTFQDTSVFENLPADIYHIVVQQMGFSNCVAMDTVIIQGAFLPRILEINTTNADCNENNGFIHIIATGMFIEFSIDGGVTFEMFNSQFSNLPAGDYDIVVREVDNPDCFVTEMVTLLASNAPILEDIMITHPTSCTDTDGILSIQAIGNNLEFSIDSGQTWQSSPLFEDLPPGDYNTLIREMNVSDCIISENATLVSPGIDETEFSETICVGEIYSFNDENLTATGIYQDTLQNIEGCDSILILNLTVMDMLENEISETICAGEFYHFNNENLTATGIYQDTLQNIIGCDSIVTLNLTIASIDVMIEWSEPSCPEAQNGWITIMTEGGTLPYRFSIDDGHSFMANDMFENLSIGNYDILGLDANGCESEMPFTLESNSSDLWIELPEDTTLFLGQTLEVEVADLNFDPISYAWESDQNVNCPSCSNLAITAFESDFYHLTITDENGCTASDDIFITVEELPTIYLPNAFSPDGDNINDVFQPFGQEEHLKRIIDMTIFSRWGELIFEEEGEAAVAGWDGTFKGKMLNTGVYVYTVRWVNVFGQEEILRGDVLMAR